MRGFRRNPGAAPPLPPYRRPKSIHALTHTFCFSIIIIIIIIVKQNV